MKRLSLLLLLCSFFSATLLAQIKPPLTGPSGAPLQPENVAKPQPFAPQIPAAAPTIFQEATQFKALPVPARNTANYPNLDLAFAPENGLPIFIKGTPEALDKTANLSAQAFDYLHLMRLAMQIEMPDEEWILVNETTDALGQTHLQLQQQYQGIPVYNSTVRLHAKDGVINLMNGRYYPTPSLPTIVPNIAENDAIEIAQNEVQNHAAVHDLNGFEHLIAGAPVTAELVVFHQNKNTKNEQLAWHIRLIPNLADRWEYFVDARTGIILNSYNNVCHLHGHAEVAPENIAAAQKVVTAQPLNTLTNNSLVVGPETANATDLLGQTRFINTYEQGGSYFMLDASRAMYNAGQSSMPDDPAGCIWTIDALNNNYEGNNFELAHVSDNDNNWNAPTGVSAHYNAGKAYEYFLAKFNRNSINGMGGNIISIINVEGNAGAMDNAFWNGAAMFYGNGNTAFQPLARALDVAGHEMSHGVVQATANLEYQGESGALNESFADIFGAMMDLEDWQMGEDCVNTSAFPSGALRDLSDPHQGGNGLSSPGWQPSHYDERYTGSQDNGGVHINSGIPNHAYYLFAEDIGTNKAEQIFYRALTEYLVKSSKFVDLRFAVEQASNDLYGSAEVTAAQNAFNAVGIGSGGGGGGQYQDDIDVNPGEDYILMSDADQDQLYIFTPQGEAIANPLTTTGQISRPSITDDGSAIVFIAADKTMQLITIDWETGATEQSTLQGESIWRNVAVSKDGSRMAALTDDLDNRVWVYDFTFEEWETYDLYNPTYTDGVETGDVLYADVLEWDFTGDWVMYDAFNRLESTFGDDIEYWDIGFLNAFDNSAFNWGDGTVEKLYSGLPEDVSVGNPTFSKNSDYIIAFDWIDNTTNEVELRAGNLQTGDVGTVFTNAILNVPNYSTDDNQMVFDAETQGGTRVLAFIDLADDKINNAGNDATVFLEGGHWGVWFAEGSRDLTDASEVTANPLAISIAPNPFSEVINIQIPNSVKNVDNRLELELVDLMGKKIATKTTANNANIAWNVATIPAGNYFLKVISGEQMSVVKILKIK